MVAMIDYTVDFPFFLSIFLYFWRRTSVWRARELSRGFERFEFLNVKYRMHLERRR
jgi:hypothetical protein